VKNTYNSLFESDDLPFRCAPGQAAAQSVRMRLSFLLPFLFLALPSVVIAEHACIEELPNGTVLKQAHHLPQGWFLVGGKSLVGPALHVSLKKQFGNQYVTGFDEGEYGYLCLNNKYTYVEVTASDFGNGVTYSRTAPKCSKCNASNKLGKQFSSGSGLHLGQTKAQVSAIIDTSITSDIASVEFEETVNEFSGKVQHTEVLRLEFANNALIRFSIYDFKESI
jgi:hypothetical protein